MKFVVLLVCVSLFQFVFCASENGPETGEEKFLKYEKEKHRHQERERFKEDVKNGDDPKSDEQFQKDRKEYRRYRYLEHQYEKKHAEDQQFTISYVYPTTLESNTTTVAVTKATTTSETPETTVELRTTTEENATGTPGPEAMEAAANGGQSADAVTETNEQKSSLVDLDVALMKNSVLNKFIKNQVGSVVKQSGLLGHLQQTVPQVNAPSTGDLSGLTGAVGGLTGGVPAVGGLTGGLPVVGGLPGTQNLNNNNNVAQQISSSAKHLLAIDLNGKQFLALPL